MSTLKLTSVELEKLRTNGYRIKVDPFGVPVAVCTICGGQTVVIARWLTEKDDSPQCCSVFLLFKSRPQLRWEVADLEHATRLADRIAAGPTATRALVKYANAIPCPQFSEVV